MTKYFCTDLGVHEITDDQKSAFGWDYDLYDTKELAIASYIKENIFKMKDNIRKHNENAAKATKNLEAFLSKYSHFIDQNPNEFI